MLFNSYVFIGLFLPASLIVYYLFHNRKTERLTALLIASFVFYGYWDYRLLPLFAGSILGNWLIARWYHRAAHKLAIPLGVFFNLLLIVIFKYADFLADSFATVAGMDRTAWGIILPLGISFYTFQQISYLVDLKTAPGNFRPLHEYALYVSFFPQLIAGPIVRCSEIVAQYDLNPLRSGLYERLSKGSILFFIGLMKKVLIADPLASAATPLFDFAAGAGRISMADAWLASINYTVQLYFDFSGYSDMAVGIGLLFGFQLPFNFNIPYIAKSISEFWLRWHLTLSRFLRDYLYIPLGGNRYGLQRQMLALFITMFLAGLWHGAGWVYAVFGILHGLALCINHLWRKAGYRLPAPLAWLTFMIFFITSLAVFRSANIATSMVMVKSMYGLGDLSLATIGHYNPGLLIAGIIISMAGPTSQDIVFNKLRPHPILAMAMSMAAIYTVLTIGNHGYSEFIYFQF